MTVSSLDPLTPIRCADSRHGLTVLACLFAIGIAIGGQQDEPIVWPWLVAAIACVGAGLLVARRSGTALLLLLALSMVCIGASWMVTRGLLVTTDDLAARMCDERRVVTLRGRAQKAPVVRDRAAGSMAVYDYRPPATYFPMNVEAVIGADGDESRVSGRVLVRVVQILPPFEAGDTITATGVLMPIGPPRNPGDFNLQNYARSLGQAGIFVVQRRDLVTIKPMSQRPGARIMRWRESLRRRASGWILSDLPDNEFSQRAALLDAILLGTRGPQLDGLGESFRRVGLAHLLAISGLHLGVFAGLLVLPFRILGRPRRWHGLLVIVAVAFYLLLVETRMPVLRAGIMTIAAGIGLLAGRRVSVGGLIALSALLLLTAQPDQLFSPGFQLSFGIVLGLIYFSPRVRERWFGQPNQMAASTAQMIGEWLKSSFVVAVVAWAIAVPIVIFHYGRLSLLAVPLSVIAVPVVALLLGVGYVKMVAAILLPSLSLLLAAPLSIIADVLISIALTVDGIPGSVIHVPFPPVVWSLAALTCVSAWAWGVTRRARRLFWIACAALCIWLLWPWLPIHARSPLRIDMLSVGDGTCFVVRSDSSTVVFDAGSADDLNAGNRYLADALRTLNVQSIDTIILSHANLDHYSAIIELVESFSVDEILFTKHTQHVGRSDPHGPVAYLFDQLSQHNVRFTLVGEGDMRVYGESHWTWLHPRDDATYPTVNDSSMVIMIEAAHRKLLFTGDIQATAIEALIESDADITADIMELPHHGSYNEAARRLVERVAPHIVMQSTGRSRWLNDRWENALNGIDRLVTARDGACQVIVDDRGVISVERYLDTTDTN